MKRLIALLVSVLMIAGLCTVSFAADQEEVSGNFCPADTNTPINMNGAPFDTIGSVFSIAAPATEVHFGCPSWNDDVGQLTVTLWKFDTDYETTKKKDPVAGPKEFVDFEDNSKIGFVFETPLAAGVYFMELSDAYDEGGASSGVGVWSCEAKYPGQAVFRDGEYVEKLALRMIVNFAAEIEGDPYGELPKFDKVDTGLGGDSPLPSFMYVKMSKQDFSDREQIDDVQISANEDGTMHVVVPSGTQDSKFSLTLADLFDIDEDAAHDCLTYPYLALRVKLCDTTVNMGSGEAFFYTTSVSGAISGYAAAIRYNYEIADWQTVVVDPTANKSFIDYAFAEDDWLGFRFDPLNITPTQDFAFDIDWIAFFQSEEAALAFDGDFDKMEAEKPTKAPTPTPTNTPEPTETPAETEKPSEETAASEPTQKPEDEPKNNNKRGCGSVAGGAFAVVSLAAATIFVARRKEK